MNPLKIILTLVTFTAIAISCEGSLLDSSQLPGRRDYSWGVDTITFDEAPFFTFTDIHGTSSENLWAVGPGGGLDKTIWRFTGDGWVTDGISRPISPTTVLVFDDIVWIGGHNGKIWKRENDVWRQDTALVFENYGRIVWTEIYGMNTNNLFAVGSAISGSDDNVSSVLAKYNGTKWEIVDIGIINLWLYQIKKSVNNNYYYVLGHTIHSFSEDTTFIYKFNGESLTKIFEGFNENYAVNMLQSNNEDLFKIGNRIVSFTASQFQTIVNLPAYSIGNGRQRNDIFICGSSDIEHFNGRDFEILYTIAEGNRFLLIPFLLKDAYFQIGLDQNNNSNLIIRGNIIGGN